MNELRKKPIKHLDIWSEARDILINVNAEIGELVYENFRIFLPLTSRDILTQLKLHIGKKVAILRTDLINRPILYIVFPSLVFSTIDMMGFETINEE